MALGVLLPLLLALPARAAEQACAAGPAKPLVAKLPKGASDHAFAEDKDSPYKYSELRYAHEKLNLDGMPVSIEHYGCEPWEDGERRRYAVSFKLPADSHPETDAGYWLKKAAGLLKALGVCGKRAEFPRDWCSQLRVGAVMKPEYAREQGYSVSFGFDPMGEEVLRVLVDRRADRAVLRIANVLSRAKPAD